MKVLKQNYLKFLPPIIAKKIYYEYAQSFLYPQPVSKFDGSSIYNLTLGKQTHSINKNTNYCDCLKIRYLAIPCKHLFTLWRSLGEDLFDKVLKNSNSHWIIRYPDNFPANRLPPLNVDNSINIVIELNKIEPQINDKTNKLSNSIQLLGPGKLSNLQLPNSINIKNTSKKRKASLITKSPKQIQL